MKIIGSLFASLLGLAVLSLLGAGVYFSFQFMADLYRGLDTQIAALVSIAIISILVVSLFMAWSRDWRMRADHREQLRLQRAEVYSILLEVWATYMHGSRSMTDDEMLQNAKALQQVEADLEAVERQLTLWGSSKVIHAYASCREQVASHALSKQGTLLQVGQLVSEMRKDIGTHDIGVREADLFPRLLGMAMGGGYDTSLRPSKREQGLNAPKIDEGQGAIV